MCDWDAATDRGWMQRDEMTLVVGSARTCRLMDFAITI